MRKFLVVLDDTRECLNAMRFAALRAGHTGAGVTILSVIPPEEYQHWIGVAEIMREEARERIEAHFEVFAKWMRDKQGIAPELIIREGEPAAEILGADPGRSADRGAGAGRGRRQGRAGAAGHLSVTQRRKSALPADHRAGRYVEGTAGRDHLRRVAGWGGKPAHRTVS